MTFTPLDLFASIIAPLASHFSSFDRLAIDDTGTGLGISSRLFLSLPAEEQYEVFPSFHFVARYGNNGTLSAKEESHAAINARHNHCEGYRIWH